ncbi:hypothetical protein NVP1261O_78 [Vibrio phage 1.261.O._10N.286.51.A7]|uniref:Uncharacterized protein n=1 Tax=Vibrio phage 1.261.O._10N.286.51.A7 TaxID=1881237 RepID=A0A2I7RZJ6_9CAUD|nr:hypothetical protein HOU80_gp24 [Vibrio phage 1.261.O._10N.286.51.A7]AUR99082.1 hypothetical protein NVP1261O_78 [Vibrio phage 1.261.O._10N.286.51.A7]
MATTKRATKVTPMSSNEMRQAEGFVNCSAVAGSLPLTQAQVVDLVKKHTVKGGFNIKSFVIEAIGTGNQRRMGSGIPLHSEGKNSNKLSSTLLGMPEADVLLLGKVTVIGEEASEDNFAI